MYPTCTPRPPGSTWQVNIQPAGPVEILKSGQVIFTAYPIIGLPDAWVIYEQQRRILAGKSGATPVS